jgi:hypothetical protein
MKLAVALRAFYEKHSPMLVDLAEEVASNYDGKVEELNQKLRVLYGADLSDVDLREGTKELVLNACMHDSDTDLMDQESER